jgi:hypothetical protein
VVGVGVVDAPLVAVGVAAHGGERFAGEKKRPPYASAAAASTSS